jgi:hypothetical protein
MENSQVSVLFNQANTLTVTWNIFVSINFCSFVYIKMNVTKVKGANIIYTHVYLLNLLLRAGILVDLLKTYNKTFIF